jgi:transcriptional regulator with XRE-family HTH domain
MPTLTYSLLDEQMTQDDKEFFKLLGQRVAELRKELGWTQTQLAENIGISQQLIAAYEAGARKIPASMLPSLSRLFAVPLEQLVGIEALPAKRGPASTLQRQMEQISSLPKGKQKFITEMLDALIKQQQAS